jgi:hypothetical protein
VVLKIGGASFVIYARLSGSLGYGLLSLYFVISVGVSVWIFGH